MGQMTQPTVSKPWRK